MFSIRTAKQKSRRTTLSAGIVQYESRRAKANSPNQRSENTTQRTMSRNEIIHH